MEDKDKRLIGEMEVIKNDQNTLNNITGLKQSSQSESVVKSKNPRRIVIFTFVLLALLIFGVIGLFFLKIS